MRRTLALAAVTGFTALVVLAAVPVSAQTPPSPTPSPTSSPGGSGCGITNVGCYLGALGGALGTALGPLNPAAIPGELVNSGLQSLTSAFAQSATAVLGKVVTSLNDNGSGIDLGAPWFLQHYAIMLALSVILLMWAAAMAATRAALIGQENHVPKVFGLAVYSGFMMAGPVLIIVALGLQLTDWMTNAVLSGVGANIGPGLTAFADRLNAASATGGGGGMGLALLLVLALAAFIGALLIWVALLIRLAVIFISVSFFPLAYAGRPHPSFAGTARKLGHLVGGAVIAKFLLAAIVALGVSWFANGNTTDIGHDLAFGVVLLLAPIAPWKLISKVSGVMVAGGVGAAGRAPVAVARKAVAATRHSRVLAFAATGRHEGVFVYGGGKNGSSRTMGARPPAAGQTVHTNYFRARGKDGNVRPASVTHTEWGPGGSRQTTSRYRFDGSPAETTHRTSTARLSDRPAEPPRRTPRHSAPRSRPKPPGGANP